MKCGSLGLVVSVIAIVLGAWSGASAQSSQIERARVAYESGRFEQALSLAMSTDVQLLDEAELRELLMMRVQLAFATRDAGVLSASLEALAVLGVDPAALRSFPPALQSEYARHREETAGMSVRLIEQEVGEGTRLQCRIERGSDTLRPRSILEWRREGSEWTATEDARGRTISGARLEAACSALVGRDVVVATDGTRSEPHVIERASAAPDRNLGDPAVPAEVSSNDTWWHWTLALGLGALVVGGVVTAVAVASEGTPSLRVVGPMGSVTF